MLKYADTLVTFSEVPNEITLCINISGCKNNCPGCHSPWLWKDEGTILDAGELGRLIRKNKGISCVAFMGGDTDPGEVNNLANMVKTETILKTAWYSGKQELSDQIVLDNFDYIKLGPYIEAKGPLDNPNTNQVFYEVNKRSKMPLKFELKDVTYIFWK